jgi:hypothetical protein
LCKFEIKKSQEANNLFGLGPNKEEMKEQMKSEEYTVPAKRACGRPHMAGWLDLLEDAEISKPSDEDVNEVYESDNWREIISDRQRISR